MKVLMDKEQWSEESKRSYSYDNCEDYYEDIKYKCYSCGLKSIFSALDQKETFEVRKSYIWQRRVLCSACYSDLSIIKKKICEFEILWDSETENQKANASYIEEWLSLLKVMPKYGKGKNEAAERQLTKLLNKIA